MNLLVISVFTISTLLMYHFKQFYLSKRSMTHVFQFFLRIFYTQLTPFLSAPPCMHLPRFLSLRKITASFPLAYFSLFFPLFLDFLSRSSPRVPAAALTSPRRSSFFASVHAQCVIFHYTTSSPCFLSLCRRTSTGSRVWSSAASDDGEGRGR